jgi:2,4-dienoyl-CoA reductase-like NADH-dependent reductase (Old Yellow Enzyme family)/thioredoxin reductase
MPLNYLFSEYKIGSLNLKNRVVLPAMGTLYPDRGGLVSEKLIAYHVARAAGGCGMNIVEITAVHPTSKAPRNLAIYDDSFIPGLTRLADAIKAAGGRAAIQLWHAGRQTYSRWTGGSLVAPSPIPCPRCKDMPVELTREKIGILVEAYGDAAWRAKEAGFEAVEVHGAHGYLIAQFMSAYSNKRTDEYGGSLANRARFALAIVNSIRKKVGAEFPVVYRLSADEHVPGGLKIEDTAIIVKMLEEAGIDAIHVSAGVYESLQTIIPPLDLPVGMNMENVAVVKSLVKIPVIAAIRINDPVYADRIIAEGKADFIAVGRGQLADPDFCNKAKAGDFEEIIKCIGCNQGCADRLFVEGKPISCLRNPSTGREAEYTIKPTLQKKRVLVVGGGPAGLETASVLKKRGHDVILIEKTSRLGGQFFLAGAAPRKKEMADAALQMGRIAGRLGVDIRLNTPLTMELVADVRPDEIVVATGSRSLVLDIEGCKSPHVATGHEVLEGLKSTGKNVAVIGGGLIGMEVAELLCSKGKKVTIIEMLDEIANGLGSTRKKLAMKFIEENSVRVFVQAKCLKIKENSVVVEQNRETREIRDIDSVVIAVGVQPDCTVEALLKEKGYSCRVIGDAVKARKALEAIWDGAEIGRAI